MSPHNNAKLSHQFGPAASRKWNAQRRGEPAADIANPMPFKNQEPWRTHSR